MYPTALVLHSVNRWLVLASLVYAIWLSWSGMRSGSTFSRQNDTVRHVTATIAHIQLMLGIYLYMISPLIKRSPGEAVFQGIDSDLTFFRLIHTALMAVAVVVITIGSARAKRAAGDAEKFKTMLVWFSIGLLIILAAIPWPFSPLANRPYFRAF